MIFSWLRKRRRRRYLQEPFPIEWEEALERHVRFWELLSRGEQERLRDLMKVFIPEKNWEGCGGLELTVEMKAAIAAQACLLILHIPHDYYSMVETILVYPGAYLPAHPVRDENGLVTEGTVNIGEAWHRGPVILSWEDALAGARGDTDGHNVILHEFAHKLDMMDGLVDGTPPLATRELAGRWREVMSREFEELREQTESWRAPLIDEYGATNEAEFFAVAVETFFELADEMRIRHPELYDLLKEYFGHDPAKWPSL